MALRDVFNLAADHFKSADFAIKAGMKVGEIQDSFMENFGLTLRLYHGVKFAEESKTLKSISTLRKKNIDDEITVQASMKVEEVVKLFKETYGLRIKLADRKDTHLLPEHVTIGQAQRGEYKVKGH
jgi:hypothetical protein